MKKIIAILIILWSAAACSAVALYPEESVAIDRTLEIDTVTPYKSLSNRVPRKTLRDVKRRPVVDIIYEYD